MDSTVLDFDVLHEFLLILMFFKLELFFILLAIVACILRRIRIVFLMLSVAILAFFWEGYGRSSEGKDRAWDLRAVSFSMMSSNVTKTNDIKQLLKGKYDLIALQEVSSSDGVAEFLINAGYYVTYREDKPVILASLCPILRTDFIGNIQRVELNCLKVVTVYNLHAPKFFKGVLNYNHYFRSLLSDVNNARGVVLIMGDFNSLSTNIWRSKIEKFGFVGALMNNADGWRSTFPSHGRRLGIFGSFLPIDEIYIKGAMAAYAKVLHVEGGSDHYPVLAGVNFFSD